MNTTVYHKLACRLAALLMLPALLFVASCKEDLDEDNLYTFTGETIESYLANRPDSFSNFNYILKRAGMDKILSAYGTYTCFAPTNEAVMAYIDSLYADTSCKIEHNGMTAPGLEGLSDSLCNDIAKFHLAASEVMAINMQNGMTIRTMLGRDVNTSIDSVSGRTVVNSYSLITKMDNEMENGVIHIVDNVLRRSNLLVTGEMSNHPDLFTIWKAAIDLTGLEDSLLDVERKTTVPSNAATYKFYCPEKAVLGYTIFAETDSVLKKHGINDINDLIAYANRVYEHCADPGTGWYDYYRNKGVKVSTGDDYRSPYNCLNMFLRYHIAKLRVPYNKLVTSYNEVSGVPLYDYWETMLPKTLFKTLRSAKVAAGKIFINRYEANNTLTDQIAALGSDGIHQVVEGHAGIEVMKNNIQALNGYIHPISDMMVYEEWVPKGVLNERIRIDFTALIPEMMSASLRCPTYEEVKALNDGVSGKDGNLSGDYVRIPTDFSPEHLILYNGENTRLLYLPGASSWYNYQGDEFNGKGTYDVAFRLPPVPDGVYEIRLGLSTNNQRGMYQFYLGEGTNNRTKMEALDIPVDERLIPQQNQDGTPDVSTGWCQYTLLEDLGVESDKSMRNLGWMRGPLYFTTKSGTTPMRGLNNNIRRIVTRHELKQGDNWLRIKSVLEGDQWQPYLDYIEIVPAYIYNNSRYLEDMY